MLWNVPRLMPAATELMEKLLKNSEPSNSTNAAIALYRITGVQSLQSARLCGEIDQFWLVAP